MKAGLLGRKLGHSLSPQIHRLFGDYDYRLYEREPEEVADFVRSGDLDFFNVTIPYKVDVFRLCDELSPLAQRLGNVNFVMRRADGTLFGDNTDAYGVERLVAAVGADVKGRTCAILGAGGAAMTVKAVLEDLGAAEARFVRRGELPAKDATLIVNATPVGMFPDVDGVRIDIADYPAAEFVIDLVYNPSPTRLVREALACGKRAADGLVMLIAQAYRAFELATGEGGDGRRKTGDDEDERRKTLDIKDNAIGQLSIVNCHQSPNHPIEHSNIRTIEHSNIFLYGPPASGKSTLGAKLAAAMGREWVDLDATIVEKAGKSIPEIFAAEGEATFRALEKGCLRELADRRGLIVSLGGGALLDAEARQIAEASGRVVCLDCPLEVLLGRLSGASRPLAADRERLRRLVETRKAHYASFPTRISFNTVLRA